MHETQTPHHALTEVGISIRDNPTVSQQTSTSWDQHYISGNAPWDSGHVAAELLEAIDELEISKATAVELGCGTGTNAMAMARLGMKVTAVDIAPQAISLARQKAGESGIDNIDFRVCDILEEAPVSSQSTSFAFDRGCFHTFDASQRGIFVKRVYDALAADGWWLTACGNADDTNLGGPPRMTGAELVAAVEPMFEVHKLERRRFRDVKSEASTVYLNWTALLRKRA